MNPNSRGNNGDTPLVYALTSPHTADESILHLLALGMDVNQFITSTGRRWSPLSIALKCERWSFAEKLLEHGAELKTIRVSALPYANGIHIETVHPLLPALFVKRTKNQRIRKRIIRTLMGEVDPNMEIPTHYGVSPLLSNLVYWNLPWETELLLAKGRIDIERRDTSGLTALERALSPSSGSSEIAALLLQNGARIPRESVRDILHLTSNICQTPDASIVKATLDQNKGLGPIFQVLYRHCSTAPSDRDQATTEFLAGCPTWMESVTKDMDERKLTNVVVMKRMKGQFEFVRGRPRKSAPQMERWWMARNVKRRALGDA
ncbi:hypothetical protein F4778DRAFT_102724 [Xylariomycetidae sp. FL2044]|nr:hypothetical protein F4778DRAFT_102724 [Xylariomycetidae sp. FL2044]